jgi:hypothetical protein
MTRDYADVSPFVEAQLIIAAQEGDRDAMDRTIAEMLPNERTVLALACELLISALERGGR